jgi:uncharacterized membrane protein YkvA (DUF1232 family)
VLGYLDDVILLPLAIMLAIRLLPPELLAEFRIAAAHRVKRPTGRIAAIAIIGLWIAVGALLLWAIW